MIRTLLLLHLLLLGNLVSQANNPLDILKARMTDLSFDIPNEKRPVPTHSTNEENLLKSLDQFNADGSYKKGLAVISEAEKQNAGSKWDQHKDYLKDVKNIAVLYGYNNYYSGQISASHHGNPAYKELIYKTLKWYFANHKPPTSVYHETFNYQPYKGTIVGLMEYTGMLLFNDFHSDRQSDANIQKLFEDIVNYCHHVITDNPQTRGPNWSFRYGNCMRHVLFSNDPAEMDIYMKVNDASIDFDVWADNGRDGVWPDWSLTHHGDMNYWGMYGTSWLGNTLDLASIVKGTSWEYSERAVQFIEQSATEGLQWILFHGNCEITTAPKRLTYYLDRTENIASEVITQLEKLLALHGDKLKNHFQVETMIENIDPSWKESLDTYNEVTGNKYFWNTEYHVHRCDNFSIAVRRCSQRVRGPEDSSNSDIKCHLHFGNGYTSILRNGDEYRLSRLGWDYQSLPGITAERNDIVNSGKAGSTKRGLSLFSGGLSEGGFGAGAFEMKLGEYNQDTKSWTLINGAGALKGNFFLDKEMVCLGQDVKRIKAGSDEIWTTLNQLQRKGEVIYSLDNKPSVTIALSETTTDDLEIDSIAWFWHDRVGYIIKTDKTTRLKLLAERRALNPLLMKDKSYVNALSSEDKAAGTINMFQVAINHGINPDNEKYAYRVIPDISLEGLQQQLTLNSTIILQNENKVQAVYNAADQILDAVFYEPGEFTFDTNKTVRVDKKAIVQIRQINNNLVVSAANPVHRGLTPEFVGSSSATIGELYETPINITLLGFSVDAATNDSSVVAIQLPVARAYEGQTISKKVELKDNGGFSKVVLPILDDIKINNKSLKEFSSSVFFYEVSAYIDDSMDFEVTASTWAANTIEYLNEHSNTVQIKVTGENGFSIYTVSISKKGSFQDRYTETFENLENTGGFMTTQFIGEYGITWNLNAAKYATYQGTGGSVYIRGGHVESFPIGTGIGNFSVTLMNKWNDEEEPVVTNLFINDTKVASLTNYSKDTVYTFLVDSINIAGDFILKLTNSSPNNKTLVIDNISWTPHGDSTGTIPEQEAVNVNSISLDKSTVQLYTGNSSFLYATIFPNTATDKSLIWNSSNLSIVTVENGIITAMQEGKADVSVTTVDGSHSATCKVVIYEMPASYVSVSGVSLNAKTIQIEVDQTTELIASVEPDNATEDAVMWSSSDNTIIKVEAGQIRALKSGTATVTVKTRIGSYEDHCVVTVTDPYIAVSGISLSNSEIDLYLGEATEIQATIEPANATNKALVWSSSDNSIATVDNGIVTGVSKGETTIVATSEDGSFQASCRVSVIWTTGVKTNEIENIEVLALPNMKLQINNAQKGSTYHLYSITGALLQKGEITGNNCTIQAHKQGIHIISVNQNHKVLNKLTMIM
jgi:uncharacterized protein YjdB